MTAKVLEVVDTFQRLSEAEQREALAEILRRSTAQECSSLSDAELTALADELFLEMDRAEARDEESTSR